MLNQIQKKRKGPYLEPPSKLFVEKEAREFSSAGPLKELHKDLPEWPLKFVSSFLELLVPHKVCLVVVSLELLEQCLKLILVEVLVDLSVEEGLHLIKVSGVEPWSQEGLLDVALLVACSWLCGGGGWWWWGGSGRHSYYGAEFGV